MNKLILDLSPAIVNRTAVYHMVIDVSKRLSIDYDTQLSVLGKRISWKKSPALLSELNPKKENYFKRLIGKHINGSFFRPITYFFHNRPVPSGTRRLFFDALYVPFAGLSHRDIVIVHDLTTLTFPSWHGVKVSEAYAKAFERISSSRCRIISVSQSTTHELRFHLGISSERIVTIPNYLRISDFESSSENSGNDAENFFLFIGSSEKRKNLSGLIQAFNRTGLANEGYSLKIVGMDGNDAEKIRDLSLEIAGVELLGFVDDKTLAKLYSRCRAFLYPSFWEGFGMPLLEAMAQGCICVSTSTGASPEVGGNAVIYVDPCNIDSIAAGILTTERMGSEERNTMKVLARERAKLFSFEKYYERMKNTIQCGFEK